MFHRDSANFLQITRAPGLITDYEFDERVVWLRSWPLVTDAHQHGRAGSWRGVMDDRGCVGLDALYEYGG